MDFKEQLPEWNKEGVKPPKTMIDEGWEVGHKPPADWFNWFFNRTYVSLKELREKMVDMESNISVEIEQEIKDIKGLIAENEIKFKEQLEKVDTDLQDKINTEIETIVSLIEGLEKELEDYWSKDELEIGGRNYIPNSDLSTGFGAAGFVDIPAYGELRVENGELHYENTSTSEASRWELRVNLEEHETYTVSFDYIASTAIEISRFSNGASISEVELPPSSSWKQGYGVFRVRESGRVRLRFYTPDAKAGEVFKTRNWKIEKGNIPTDWTPAPEDIVGKVESVNGKEGKVVLTSKDINHENNQSVSTVIDGKLDSRYINLNEYPFDEVKETGFYQIRDEKTSPTKNTQCYLMYVGASDNTNNPIVQQATNTWTGDVYTRSHNTQGWTEWRKMTLDKEVDEVKQSGVESNKILVDALNSKKVSASTKDSIKTNVKKVNDIEVGTPVPLIATNDLSLIPDGVNKSVQIKWSSPKDVVCQGVTITTFKEDVLVRNTSRIPTSIDDGTVLGRFARDKHKYTAFNDSTISYDRNYYYAVFSVSDNDLITQNGSGVVKVRKGIPLSDVPIGAKVKHPGSKYYGKDIIFLKIAENHPGYPQNSTTLLSEQIICLKAMDAKEPSNSNSDRRSSGNNRYIHSNLRQWLNSSASSWYKAQHSADEPPTSSGVTYNAYDKEKGFMANLTPELRSAILPTSLQVLKNDIDGGGLESFTDKIFMPSCTEVGLSNNTSYDEGTKFDYFKSNSDRVATTTKECVENSDYTTSGLKPDDTWYWWTRTPGSSSSTPEIVHYVNDGGSRKGSSACYGSRGVRPALNLDSGILVSDKPDSDGVYSLLI